MRLTAPKTKINSSNEKVFHLVSDCSNFGKYLPPDATPIEATNDFFRFEMKGIAQFKIEIIEKIPFRLVHYRVGNDKNIPIDLKIDIIEEGSDVSAEIQLDADIPFFLQGMVKTPLQKFIEILTEKIKNEAEKE